MSYFDAGPMNFRYLLAQSNSGEPIPAGLYFAHIYETEYGETGERSKDPGKPKLIVTYKIDGGDYDGHEIDRTYLFLGKAAGFFRQLCRAAAPGEISDDQLRGAADLTVEDIDRALVGKRVVIEVRTEVFRGRTENDVPNVYAENSEEAKKLAAVAADDRLP